MTFLDRLKELIATSPSDAAFARECGIPNSTLASWLRGTAPAMKQLVLIAKAKGVSLDWLITGRGEMYVAVGEAALSTAGLPRGPDTYKQVLDEAEHALMELQDAPFEAASVPDDAKHIERNLALVSERSTDPKLKARADYLLSRGFGDAAASARITEHGKAATDRIRETGLAVRRALDSLGWSAAPLGVVEAMKTLAYAYRVSDDDLQMALGMIKAEWDHTDRT